MTGEIIWLLGSAALTVLGVTLVISSLLDIISELIG